MIEAVTLPKETTPPEGAISTWVRSLRISKRVFDLLVGIIMVWVELPLVPMRLRTFSGKGLALAGDSRQDSELLQRSFFRRPGHKTGTRVARLKVQSHRTM
ncbi:hypothetical protein AVEN_272434-1 [Araneus ventricosus]|uniref:Uncharacterized protein n=1 Tax=Araneus ventricosus TaxID=182803 RepID=A0A4Y2LM48_ARAVE|nr:hypothetical protein AVEN_272434-1 [Araneus ventricosus]